MPIWLLVLIYALLTAVATGLGALPFLFARKFPKVVLGLANAVAGGLMMGASFGLIYEGLDNGDATWRTLGGVLAGLVFIVVTRRFIHTHDQLQFAGLNHIDARRALLLVGVMTLHSAAEGVGVGVAFGEGIAFGVLVTIAIAIHNIPEGLAISLVMVPRGASVFQAALWSVFSSLPQPIMAVPAYLFVDHFGAFLPVGLGFAAGAMIWMVFYEMIPEALSEASPNAVAIAATISLVTMQAVQLAIG